MSEQNFFSYGDAESVLANYANEIKNTKVLSSSVTIGGETETTVEGAIGAIADVIPTTATEQNKLATTTDVTGEDIAATVTGTAVTITDSADARVQNIQIFGRTENGSSVGDNGLTVSVPSKNLFNINGEVNSNTVNSTTPPQNWTIDKSASKNTVSGNVLTAYRNMNNVFPDGQVIAVKAGQSYTLSFRMLESEHPGIVRVDYWNSSTSKLVYQVNWWNKKFDRQSITFVAQTNLILLGFGCGVANASSSFTDIMLEEGGQVTDYEPYRLSTLSVTTGLPLRGILKTVDLGTINWGYNSQTPNTGGYPAFPRFFALSPVSDVYVPFPAGKTSSMYMDATASCSSRYTVNVYSASGSGETVDKTICVGRNGNVYIVDYDYTSAASLKAALSGIILTYPSYCDELDANEGTVTKRVDTDGTALNVPVVTPLSATELSAYRQLRTHAGSTKINVTDTPYIAVNYLKNTDNGKAVAAIQDDADKQINNKQDALTFDSTPTENSTNPVTSGGMYSALAGKQRIMQLSILPTASSELLGKIYQFVGTTTSSYTNGFFYKCVEGSTPGTYEWQEVNVQAGGGDQLVWLGTRAEHTAAEQAGTLPPDAIIGIEDEQSSGGGSTVEVTQIKTSGEKIATITVDGVGTDIYASAGTSGDSGMYYDPIPAHTYLYGFNIDTTNSDPDARVSYPLDVDNAEYDSAYMDFTNDVFNYGDWNLQPGQHFMPRPCMLNTDTTVAYYLDPDDYTLRADGETASDVANSSFNGNAMMEWNKIYTYRTMGANGVYKFRCSDVKLGPDWECWCNYDQLNQVIPHFYTPIYNGSYISSRIRSLSGQTCGVSQTAATEIVYAKTVGDSYYTEVIADRLLINDLLVLISKSTNTQTKFGKGNVRTDTSGASASSTGQTNDKGLFWGTSSTNTKGVKVFGMENYWGNVYRRIAGLISTEKDIFIKITRGTKDGTLASDYNLDGTGYIQRAGAVTNFGSSGYISKMFVTSYGRFPAKRGGSSTTYEPDYCYTVTTAGTYYAEVGGYWNIGNYETGAFCVRLNASGSEFSGTNASLSCKPILT